MDGQPPSGVPNMGNGKGKSTSASSGGTEGEDDSDEESSSSSIPLVISPTSPTTVLDSFRKEWEAELKKTNGNSNVNSALNLASASSASLANPYPNPTSMAGAVAKSKSPLQLEEVSRTLEVHHPFACAGPGLIVKEGTAGQSPIQSPDGPEVYLPASIPDTGTIEEQARVWFLQGIGFERHGDLYDAVRCYRRAIQLVPDIEYRISTAGGNTVVENSSDDNDDDSGDELNKVETENADVDVKDEDEDVVLIRRFLKSIERKGWQFFDKANPNKSDKVHLGDFPVEVVSYMMRWLVSNDLDVRSLDVLSSVCKGCYVICRDDKLWQMICERTWDPCVLGSGFSSYREMFLNRPRVRFDGCYISRVTYIRAGEHSFQDQSYRPWHFVEYYRYIRFFPDGHVHFLTCSDEPSVSVPGLKDKQPRNLATLKGKYQLYGNNIVTAMVKRVPPPTSSFNRSTKRQQETQQSTSFHIEFEICPVKGRNNSMLKWSHHAGFITKTVTVNNGKGNVNRQNQNSTSSLVSTTFELSSTKYPPMYFSRVKSYTTRSDNILE